MKVSIVTACYNREKTIASCLESVRSQNYPDIEHIVVDGASKDRSVEVIRAFPHISKWISEPDTGMYNALNKGIQLATGEVIGLLHSDDMFYAEDSIAKIAEVFHQTGADIVYANGQYVSEDDVSKVKRIYKAKPFKRKYLYYGWIPLHTTIFVKADLFKRYGLYEEHFRIASDYEISLRWLGNNELKKVFLDDWVVKMRLGGKSTDMKQQQTKSAEDLQIIRKYKLYGKFTLFCKIARKIPQYLLPRIRKY